MEELDCSALVKRINTVLERIANSSLQQENLTVSQWRCLSYLYSRGGRDVHLKDIERDLDVSQPTVAGVLKRLSAKGHVVLTKADYSANSKSASLTESGMRLCETGLRQKSIMDGLLLGPLDEDERIQFRRLLQKVYAGMQKE